MFRTASLLSVSNIYEVNIRQYTEEGTFRAFREHIPRLQKMGVEILWLMPVHPIGKLNRKGNLGSYYSIRDFECINPEFGTAEDFKELIEVIHAAGMKIIMDWVANHAAWDNVWTKEYPGFFFQDENGDFMAPYDWTDVIQIDHNNPEQRKRMRDAMAYWIRNFDIDGFRADLAHLTPLQFWIDARMALQHLKPDLIWLAETEDISYHQAFDISFTWNWMHTSENYIKQHLPDETFKESLIKNKEEFPAKALRLYFTSNHDENSWNGTEYDKYGKFAQAMAVGCATFPASVPLLYSGQEIPNTKQLAFFEKDTIRSAGNYHLENFYKTLLLFRKGHSVFKNLNPEIQFIASPHRIISFMTGEKNDPLIVILNFSDHDFNGGIIVEISPGTYHELFSKEELYVEGIVSVNIPSGGYRVLYKA